MGKSEKLSFAQQPPQMTILSDHPSQSSADDFLRMESRLAVVLDILRHQHTRCPITIAIYGDWGTGKTSAMHWIESQLEEWNKLDTKKRENHPRVFPVWFDPWKYHSREEVWRGIIAEVILSLFRVSRLDRQNFRTRITEAAKKFGAFLGKSFLHALSHTELTLKAEGGAAVAEGGGEVKFSGEMFQDIYDEYEKANHPEKAHLNQFEETLKHWVGSFLKPDERLALFIDDLDRCMPEVTLEVLEAIKLYLSIPQIMFVVGVDRDVVDGIAIKHYEGHGLGKEKARQYLDKIFQVEIQIPPSEQQMKEFLDRQVGALDISTGGYWTKKLDSNDRLALENGIRELARHNPRETKRLLNSALLRGRAAADNPGLCKKSDEARLFAQGVQVFLIQRIVQNWISNGRNLLREEEALDWFDNWSKTAIQFPSFKPSNRETNAAKLPKGREHHMSEADRAYEALSDFQIIGDDLTPIDKRLLLDDALLWQLLRIPFSVEVAQSTPKIRQLQPVLVSPQLATGVEGGGAQNIVATLPSVIRDRIAKELKKPVVQLVDSDLSDLKQLDLSNSAITAADLAHLEQLVGLRNLFLNETQIADAGLTQLASFTGIQSLSLDDTQITDAGVAHLTKLTKLQNLSLNSTQITNSSLPQLSKLTELQSLDLNDTQVSDDGLAQLTKLTRLQSISLNNTQVTDNGLKPLTQLADLNSISLDHNKITNQGVAQLANCNGFISLSLDNTQVTDRGLAYLSKLTELMTLSLNLTQITDHGLTHISKLNHLQNLSLDTTKVTDEGLVNLSKLTNLKTLSLNHNQISDRGLAHLKHLTELVVLTLMGTKVTNQTFKHLKELKKLILFVAPGEGITETDAVEFKTILPGATLVRI